MTKYVYDFSEGNKDMKDLLGGKGANLAEMTNMGLPVPHGFTISTEACLAYLDAGGFPEGLADEVETHVQTLESSMGKRLGDPSDPLLVSVRSGAKFSMPGMMDTVLNLGLNEESLKGLAEQSGGDMRFARDAYRRFIQMFGKIVMDVPADAFEEALDRAKDAKGEGASDTDLDADDLAALATEFLGIYRQHTGQEFPTDPREQMRLAIEAVFKSWNGRRAIDYRRQNKISDSLGTAVNVQSMVFGNRGDDSGTGVAFTRDPSTGEKVPYGDYLGNAQGEDVVAGIRNTLPLADLETVDPTSYAGLREVMATLEGHYRDMCDIEFTIEKGRLWILQTRVGKRTAFGEWVMAYEMLDEDLIDEGEALLRVDANRLEELFKRRVDATGAEPIATGLNASPGRGHRRGGVHRRRGAVARAGGGAGHPGPSRDDAGRLPRHDRGPGHPDERRRDELARGGGGARRGHPGGVRRRRDQAPDGRRAVHRERHRRARGRRHHDRRVQRQRLRGRAPAPGIAAREGAARGRGRATGTAVAFVRALDDDRRRAAPVAGSRQRRHPRPVDERARARRRGHRPVPHRAHVPRGGARPRGPQDDLRRDGGGGAGGLRRPDAAAAGRLRRHLHRDERAAGDRAAARPAAARVPARPGGARRRGGARQGQGARTSPSRNACCRR